MKEIEVKILEVDRRQIERKLIHIGAKKVFDGRIETFFFDFKNHGIMKAGNVVRLRTEGKKARLTIKKFLSNKEVKKVEEVEVVVSDMQKMKRILKFLGLSMTSNMVKHRVSYLLGAVHFDVDKYERELAYIPEFLEIEAEDTGVIHNYAGVLGFNVEDCLPWSTKELINYYSSKSSE